MFTDRPFFRPTQEWLDALSLFGRCNGTDWAILMGVCMKQRGASGDLPHVELGIADFVQRLGQARETIEKSVKKLSRTPAQGGLGVLRVVKEATSTSPRHLSLVDEWWTWAWETPAALEHASAILRRIYRTYKEEDAPPVSEEAIQLARLLRQSCIGLVPEAEVPDPEQLDDPNWPRWCETMQRLLGRRDPMTLGALIRWTLNNTFWSGQIMCEKADLRLERSIDRIHAQAQAAANARAKPSRRTG